MSRRQPPRPDSASYCPTKTSDLLAFSRDQVFVLELLVEVLLHRCLSCTLFKYCALICPNVGQVDRQRWTKGHSLDRRVAIQFGHGGLNPLLGAEWSWRAGDVEGSKVCLLIETFGNK